MSRVLLIVGSRRSGNCLELAEKIKESLEKQRVIGDIIVPGNQKIYVCTGCMDCDVQGECDFKDDMKSNVKKVEEADALIFLTPVRWNLLSSDLKVFMDRLNPLYVPKKLVGKKAILISIGATPLSEFEVEGALTSLDSFCESAKMKVIGKYQFGDCLQAGDIEKQEDKVEKMLKEIGSKLK